jgi:hypothetical protein
MTVSQQFRDHIYPVRESGVQNERRTVAEVTYTLAAPDSKEGGVLDLPPGNPISRPNQIMNEIRRQQAPVLTFEPNGVTLDGRYLIAPPPETFPDAEIGWWSEAFSDDSGLLSPPLVIDRHFDELQTFNTLGIVFDTASGNYCGEFDIEFFGPFGDLILLQEIRNNDTTDFRSPQGGIDISRVRVTLFRTHLPRRFARVIELDFGLVLTFTDKQIKSIVAVNDADPSGKTFITPELDITIDNGYMEDHTQRTLGSLPQGSSVFIDVNGAPREFWVFRHNGAPNADYAGWGNVTFLIQALGYEAGRWNNTAVRDYENSTMHIWMNGEYLAMFPEWLQPYFAWGRIPFIPGEGGTEVVQGENGLLCRVFAPSNTELGHTSVSTALQGVSFGLFSNNASRIMNSAATGEPVIYLTRGINISNNNIAIVLVGGGVNVNNAATTSRYYRPVFALPAAMALGSDNEIAVPDMIKEWDLFDARTYAPYLLRRQRADFRVGLVLPDESIEWVDGGAYYLARPEIQDRQVKLITMGNTFEMEMETFFQSSFNEMPLGVLVRQLYPWADVPVASPPIPGYFGNVNHRRALAFLIELSCCIVYEDRRNVLQFVDFTTDNGENPVDRIDYHTLIGAPVARQSEYYNSISLAEWDMSIEHRQISRTRHEPGNIQVTFHNPVQYEEGRIDLDYEITEGFELKNAIWYTMYMVGEIVRTDENTSHDAELTIHGNSITLTRSDVIYHAPWYTGLEVLRPYTVVLPFFIKEAPHFAQLRDWFLARKFEVINKQLNVDSRYRGNPAREIADVVDVQFTRGGQIQPVHIVSHEIAYKTGALSGRIKAIGDNPLLVRR